MHKTTNVVVHHFQFQDRTKSLSDCDSLPAVLWFFYTDKIQHTTCPEHHCHQKHCHVFIVFRFRIREVSSSSGNSMKEVRLHVFLSYISFRALLTSLFSKQQKHIDSLFWSNSQQVISSTSTNWKHFYIYIAKKGPIIQRWREPFCPILMFGYFLQEYQLNVSWLTEE